MKKICLLFIVLSTTNLFAQSNDESLIKQTIQQLFSAMLQSDTALLTTCFTPNAIMQSISVNKEGKTIVGNESVQAFAQQVAALPKNAADERIVFDAIKVDGNMANVWTPYQFYFNGNFSHCGVNNFVLVKDSGQWKIQYIIDTRRRQGCGN